VYFAFESDNWVLNQTIVLEIVPWVDVNLSRGWNASSKLELLTLCKSQKIYPLLTKKEAYSAQFIEKITQKYTRKEFSNLIAVEKNQYVATLSEQIVTKIGEIEVLHNQIRQNANNAFLKGDTEEAITLLKNELFAKNKAAAIDYYYLSRYYLMFKQFDKAEKICNEGLNLDPSEILLQLQLAHIYLFTERLDLAKVIHSKYKNQNINASTNWKTQTENDFLLFEKYNFPNHDFKKIIRIVD
jgi:tetratricopeptide (TPR) repeat protein